MTKTRGQVLEEALIARSIDEPVQVAKSQMLWVFQELFIKLPEEAQRDFANLTADQIIDYATK